MCLEKAVEVCGAGILRSTPIGLELLTILRRDTGKFGFPGGKIEPRETLWEATVRETEEEVGIKIESIGKESAYLFRSESSGTLKKIYVFPARIISGTPRVIEPDKCAGWKWKLISEYLGDQKSNAAYVNKFAEELLLKRAYGTHPEAIAERPAL